MSENHKRHIHLFISYSRDDQRIVQPIVQLLRVTESKVFLDVDNIEPGDLWEEQLEAALAKADTICVFWCYHSEQSTWVTREWRSAIEEKKKIIPLLLDSTPLTQELSEYQYIDFRFVEGGMHPMRGGIVYPKAPPPPGYSIEEEYKSLAKQIVNRLIPILEAD